MTRTSVSSSGAQGNSSSSSASISGDGRYVAFQSNASTLVPGDTNFGSDVFVRDRQTSVTSRVSVDSSGAQGNLGSWEPSISADGRCVAFESSATNLVPGDTNGREDVFVHDRQTGATSRVSVDSSGVQGNALSVYPSISADGRFVAFYGLATNLVPGDTNGRDDVFVHDRQTGATSRVSVNSSGVQGNGHSTYPRISANGRYVAFASDATNLVPGDTNSQNDIFVKDLQTGTIVRASADSTGSQADAPSSFASISADGRYVAFESYADNLVWWDTNSLEDVFVKDLQTAAIVRANKSSTWAEANGGSSYLPSISADGRYVAFGSLATNLAPVLPNGVGAVFVHDRLAGTTISVPVEPVDQIIIFPPGPTPRGESARPSISANGRFVAFDSKDTNLVAGDTNDLADVFVYDIGALLAQDTTPVADCNSNGIPDASDIAWGVSTDADGNGIPDACGPSTSFCAGDNLDSQITTHCPCNNFGAAGHGCANSVNPLGGLLAASGLTNPDTVVLHGSAMPASVSVTFWKGDARTPSGAVFGDGVFCLSGTLLRLKSKVSAGGASQYPDAGELSVSVRGQTPVGSGLVGYYQTSYRNASVTFCPPLTYNVTNGVRIIW